MSSPCAVPPRIRLPPHRRLAPAAAAAAAALLIRLPPHRLAAVLRAVRGRARPAAAEQVRAARTEVIAVSLRCAVDGCLQLSTATALLCRSRGAWPTWRVGVRTAPFAAHSWVEADGRVIDEPLPDGYYRPLMTVAPAPAGPPAPPAQAAAPAYRSRGHGPDDTPDSRGEEGT